MNQDVAVALLQRLQNAYPFSDLGYESGREYRAALMEMDEALGRQAVQSAIEGNLLFPSVAQLHEHYRIAREHRNRIVRDEERKAADAAADDWPKVPLREIPEVVALLERWQPKLGLDEAGSGACDDCAKEGMRYQFGQLAVCGDCAAARARVRDKLVAERKRAEAFLYGEEADGDDADAADAARTA